MNAWGDDGGSDLAAVCCVSVQGLDADRRRGHYYHASKIKTLDSRAPRLRGQNSISIHRISLMLTQVGQQLSMAFISVEISMVAKLEKVSEIAYGKMILSLCRIAPQV